MPKIIIRIFSLITLISLLPQALLAADFDYNNIITDEELQNYNSMGQVDIKNFLTSKNSYLTNYFHSGNNPGPTELALNPNQDNYFKSRSAAEIIYNAAQEAKINPQFLLTMLQKEMSLIEDSTPTENQLAFAMGYYCFDGQACNPRWRGFGKQVRSTALQFEDYLANINQRTYNPSTTSVIEGQTIRPANAATAGLYNYTPHLHGNELFKAIWDRYEFGTTAIMIVSGIIPEGSLVKARDGEDTDTIYLIHNGQKQAFSSMAALVSRYDPSRVLSVPEEELIKFTDGSIIKYSAYSILQGSNGDKYLLDGLQKRLIASDEVFRQLGFHPEEVIEVTDRELADIANGAVITDVEVKPIAQLLRAPTGGVFYVKDGTKAAIIHPDIISIDYNDLSISNATEEELSQFRQIEPIKIADGSLLMSSEGSEVYVIANGERRWIINEETFLGLGYSWSNIISVDPRILKLHKVGEPLSL